ncbi:MAG: SRPBCC family protein [Casimicrobiaceae bacterium]
MNGSVEVARSYRADARRVYDAWLDPALAGRWLFATATRPMTHVLIDARVGGTFRLARWLDGLESEYAGRYKALVPARSLAFTLSPRGGIGSTLVRAAISPRGDGCRLAVSHGGVPATHARELKERWTGILYGLGVTLESLPPAPPSWRARAARINGGEAQCITC